MASTTTALAAPAVLPTTKVRELVTRAATDQTPVPPHCIGYSARTHAFACVGHDPIYNLDHIGADDQAANLGIHLVGPATQQRWTIRAQGKRPTTQPSKVSHALAQDGVETVRMKTVALPVGAWAQVGTIELWLEVRTHEGDASFENFGELRVRCGQTERVIDVRALGIELGEQATAWLAPDGEYVAISIAGLDGGEDTYTYTLDTLVLRTADACAKGDGGVWTSIVPSE